MTEETIISASNLSKAYRIWKSPSARLKGPAFERLGRVLKPFKAQQALENKASKYFDDFYALQGIDFEVKQGESVGILGRNGAGKSTLLQLLTGTLRPTTGEINSKGRIAALLELGSGFNPEFSGRENVFLNASILGLTRKQTEDKFDRIVGFADIGSFLDQPVKTYSTGMVMRLAFAIACHVDCDILIVDEALSVGDSLFQAKCLNRISQMLDSGVTLFLTSHEVSTVKEHCSKSLLLDHGKMVSFGNTDVVSDRYYKLLYGDTDQFTKENTSDENSPSTSQSSEPIDDCDDDPSNTAHEGLSEKSGGSWKYGLKEFEKRCGIERSGNKRVEIMNVQLLNGVEQLNDSFDYGESAVIRQYLRVNGKLTGTENAALKIRTKNGTNAVFLATYLSDFNFGELKVGKIYLLEWTLDLTLQHGHYNLWAGIGSAPQGEDPEVYDCVPYASLFTIATRKPWMIDGFCAWEIKPELSLIE